VCGALCNSVKSIDIISNFPYKNIFLLYGVFKRKLMGINLIYVYTTNLCICWYNYKHLLINMSGMNIKYIKGLPFMYFIRLK